MKRLKHNRIKVALDRLNALTGIEYELQQDISMVDYSVTLTKGEVKQLQYIEEKSEIREFQNLWAKLLTVYRNQAELRQVLIIASYIHPNVKEEFHANSINYLEVSGNAKIETNGFFIYIEGQKSPKARVNTVNKSFKNVGLKLILSYLVDKQFINYKYRKQASLANVAVGSVGWILKDLRQQGYVTKSNENNNVISNKTDLFDRWVQLYPLKLKNKQLIGTYKCIDENLRLNENEKWFISALDLNEQVEKASSYTFYTNVGRAFLRSKFGLVEDQQGHIEVVEPFWNLESEVYTKDRIVNPILNYADRLTHPTKTKLNEEELKTLLNSIKISNE